MRNEEFDNTNDIQNINKGIRTVNRFISMLANQKADKSELLTKADKKDVAGITI